MRFFLPSRSLSPSLPRCCSRTNETYPSGEQCCVCLQLTHEMRSLEEDDDEEPLALRPGSAFVVVVVADDVDVDLGALLPLSPPLAPSSRSRYVSATARRYHSSVATTSSRKARARTRFFLLFWCSSPPLLLLCLLCCCRCCFEGEDGSDADEEKAAAFSWRGCRRLQLLLRQLSHLQRGREGGGHPFRRSFFGELRAKEREREEREKRERARLLLKRVRGRSSSSFFCFVFVFLFFRFVSFFSQRSFFFVQRRVLKETQFYVIQCGGREA